MICSPIVDVNDVANSNSIVNVSNLRCINCLVADDDVTYVHAVVSSDALVGVANVADV